MPIGVRWPVSVLMLDDTLSIRRRGAGPGRCRDTRLVITVSLAGELSGLGCEPAPGRAGCNTSSPWRAVL
jgi:hypothetical protein